MYDGLRIEPGAEEVHFVSLGIKVFLEGRLLSHTNRVIQAPSDLELQARVLELPNKIRNSYEDSEPISVEVECHHTKYSMTFKQLEEYMRSDAADTERQIDAWML